MSKSIALLVCDTPLDSIVQNYGDYHVLFTNLLHASGKQLGIHDIADKCKLDAYDVVHEMAYPTEAQLDAYDGLLITGSSECAAPRAATPGTRTHVHRGVGSRRY